eukprot:GFUD01007133.1.p1 GENE.GFUD01007133.1~~GFUD01007133.1.p1  ORF type:complete len:307 (-),score=107.28 GFUD01007133.1:267-1187(-)
MEETKVMFKKSSKKRPVRQREKSVSSEEEASEEFNVEDFERTRELQKLRKRAAGTNIVTLALGKKVAKIEDTIDDAFNPNSGGLMEMKDMKGFKQTDDAFDVGTQFFKETHIRDEDDEMRKFIETEMDSMKGSKPGQADTAHNQPEYLSPEDAALLALPEHLRKSTFKKDQQMLSAQMLSGIPEVDLGIDAKIQNIERTEKAKKKLLEECKQKGIDVTNNYTPTNYATNFVQHDRYKIEGPTEIGREKERPKDPGPVARPNTVNIYAQEDDLFLRNEKLRGKASDDDAVQRFKDAEKLAATKNRKK